MKTGPSVTSLTHHLSTAPLELVDTADLGHTPALLNDTLLALGMAPLAAAEKAALMDRQAPGGDNRLRAVRAALSCLSAPWFTDNAGSFDRQRILAFLTTGLCEVSRVVNPRYFITDPEGREELARRVLQALELLPEGETAAQAADRMTSVDSVERKKVVEKSREAQRRAQEIREALARKEAEEAASKMTRD